LWSVVSENFAKFSETTPINPDPDLPTWIGSGSEIGLPVFSEIRIVEAKWQRSLPWLIRDVWYSGG
jgi:hypothetical protein